ncbi:hypothetical protein QO005_004601 [Rhizobium paknamense]|uniref:Uncharacterized protein n=1 Tax=Rhizobium paknamense TaxID=1206817 RepID=A0ABU0ILX7_9HYPH|nr:hypothetical protein [Rhizobium paknamense]
MNNGSLDCVLTDLVGASHFVIDHEMRQQHF